MIMEKTCPGYNTALLERELQQLIHATNYRGQVKVTFPSTNHIIKIRPSNQFTRLRYNSPLRWFFYVTFLWIITWPILWFITKKYNVIKSVWPISVEQDHGRIVRITEEQWLMKWKPPIRRAVLAKRTGWVSE